MISSRWVLTAAHCQFATFGDIIVAKTVNRDSGELIFKVDHVVNHPLAAKNKFGVWEEDFQLLRLSEEIEFDDNLLPICLPTPNETFKEKKCWLAGWGRTSAYPKRYAPILQETLERGEATKSDFMTRFKMTFFIARSCRSELFLRLTVTFLFCVGKIM